MQNRNELIAAWKADLAASEKLPPEALAELESHMYDAMDDLEGRGLAADEAFLVSRHRLGGRESLEAEFSKAHPHHPWRRAMMWMACGVFGWFLLNQAIGLFASLAAWLAVHHAGIGGSSLAQQGVRLLLIALAFWFLWEASRGSIGKRSLTLFRYTRSLRTWHLVGGATVVFVLGLLAQMGMTNAYVTHAKLSVGSSNWTLGLGYGLSLLSTLILIVCLPCLIGRLRRPVTQR